MLLLACCVLPRLSSAGDPDAPRLDLGAAHRGTTTIDLALLAQAAQPDAHTAFFTVAREVFGSRPMASFAEVPELQQEAARHGLSLLGGPMLGCLTDNGARVWVRTAKPAAVTVVVTTPAGQQRFGPVHSTTAADLTAVVPVSGLPPASRCPYQVLVDDEPVPLPPEAAITTTTSSKGTTRIAFGADFHKTGLWHAELLGRVVARSNLAMVLLGDLAVDDRDNRVGLHRSDYLLRDFSPAWRRLAANAAIYATWDDHDYFNNDLSGIPRGFTAADRANVRAVWHHNWNNPGRNPRQTDRGIQFRTRLGPCDLIMLDTRSQRGAKGEPDCFLGGEQARWLEQQLAGCQGPFVILTSGTMWSDNISAGKDSWGKWDPAGREKIFSCIEKHRVGGVLLLSGDRHGARVIRIPRPSGFAFHEFELGSLGAHTGPPATGEDPGSQPFGLTGLALFGEFEFDTSAPDPAVTMRAVDSRGAEKFTVTLRRSQLTPP